MEPQQNKADISTPFTFPAGLKFFHEISARKTKTKQNKKLKTSQKFSLPLTSTSPQEHRTTTSVTHLQYSKFATCIFLSFKSNTDRMKRFSGKSGVPPGQNKYKRIQCPHAMHQWCWPSPAVRPSCGTLTYTKINLTSSVSGLFSAFQQTEQTLLAISISETERSFLFQLLNSHLAAALRWAAHVQLVHWPFHGKKREKILY